MRKKVLVLGGNGFIGRHAVAALNDNDCDLVIGSRFEGAPQQGISQQALRLEELLGRAPTPVIAPEA